MLLTFASLLLVPSQIHVVQDEAELVAALDLAQPGDTVLIQDTFLPNFSAPIVLDKGISLTSAFPGGSRLFVPGGFTVANLPAGERVTFRGIRLDLPGDWPAFGYPPGVAGLVVRDCAGSVHFEGGSVEGGRGFPGLLVENSEQVYVSDSALEGGSSYAFVSAPFFPTSAGPGLLASHSTVRAERSSFTGLAGSGDCAGSAPAVSGQAGPGVRLEDATLIATDCAMEGGDGYTYSCIPDPCVGFAGASGILGEGSSVVELIRCELTGGETPIPAACNPVPEPPLDGFDQPGSAVAQTQAGVSLVLQPWSGTIGGTATLLAKAAPGDQVVALLAGDWSPPFPLSGVSVYLNPALAFPTDLGVASTDGLAGRTFPLPTGSIAPSGVEFWAQAFALSGPAPVTLSASLAGGFQLLP